MAKRFVSEDKILEIQQSTDIVDLISEYLPLKKAGASYKALCPFHDEKTPSFIVSPLKQIYHCFGCHKGGNVFTFLMALEKVDFREALRMLAERSGIKLVLEDKVRGLSESKRAELLKINRTVAEYYHKKLLDSTEAEIARAYLKKRGFNQGSIARFLLGYASPGWNDLINYAREKGLNEVYLEELGLIIPRGELSRDKTNYYDRFRNRLIFPIFNTRDRVIGFGGRALDDPLGNSTPVYLNSPESELFSKGKTLYGLNFAKESLHKEDRLCIVEGYTDVIMAHQLGSEGVVATLGTALTADHIRSIRRYVNKVILVYDADVAGALASARTLDLFLAEEIELYIAQLPQGLDPYDCLVKKGRDFFIESLNAAKELFSYRLELVKSKYDLTEIDGKTKAVDEMLESIRAVPNVIKRNLQLQQLSEKLRVPESILRARLKDKARSYRAIKASAASTEIKPGVSPAPGEPLKTLSPAEVKAGEEIIHLLLAQNKLIPLVRQSIKVEDLPTPQSQQVVQEIFSLYERHAKVTLDMLLALISDEPELINWVVNIVERSSFKEQMNYEKHLKGCLAFLERRRKKLKEEPLLVQQQKAAQLKGDKQALDKLLAQYLEFQKSLR